MKLRKHEVIKGQSRIICVGRGTTRWCKTQTTRARRRAERQAISEGTPELAPEKMPRRGWLA
jgi:hypothetical protein